MKIWSRIRGYVSQLSKALPPKHVVDRLAPLFTFFAIIVGLANYIYTAHSEKIGKNIDRTLELENQYIGKYHEKDYNNVLRDTLIQNGELIDHIGIRCDFYNNLIKSKELTGVELDCSAPAVSITMDENPFSESQKSTLREIISKAESKLEYEDEFTRDIYELLDFYLKIIRCTENRACDLGTVLSVWERDFVTFVNEFCVFFLNDNDGTLDTEELPLVYFLAKNANSANFVDENRTNIFFCERHRQLFAQKSYLTRIRSLFSS